MSKDISTRSIAAGLGTDPTAGRVSVYTEAELGYLSERRLARIATVGADGTPHVVPVGWSYNPELDTIDIGGHDFASTKKYRDVARNGRAAIVIDDVLPPFRPRGIEVRGLAEAVGGAQPMIRIRARRVVSWGLSDGGRNARDTGQ